MLLDLRFLWETANAVVAVGAGMPMVMVERRRRDIDALLALFAAGRINAAQFAALAAAETEDT